MSLHINSKGEGYPLVFFHGWGFDHKVWLKLAGHIAKQYRLYLVDLPGFGLSSRMNWNVFKQNLLKQLPAQFALIGWSMGGLFATRLAIEEPYRVAKLICIASSPRFIKEEGWPGVEKSIFEQFLVKLDSNPQLVISQFVRSQLKNYPYYHDHEHMLDRVSLQESLQILINWDLRQQLHSFSNPSYFMFGRLDAITPKATMAAMEKFYPQFNYILFNKAAHMPFLSHQHEFIAILKDRLS